MLCMNKTDRDGKIVNKKLFGVDDVHPHRRIDLVYIPCIPQQINDANRNNTDLCLADLKDPLSLANKLKADIEYLQTPDFTVVYNHERVNIK